MSASKAKADPQLTPPHHPPPAAPQLQLVQAPPPARYDWLVVRIKERVKLQANPSAGRRGFEEHCWVCG
ncbi:hypothetical protein SRHO_G00289080 [Serrasalmus rhombeus]